MFEKIFASVVKYGIMSIPAFEMLELSLLTQKEKKAVTFDQRRMLCNFLNERYASLIERDDNLEEIFKDIEPKGLEQLAKSSDHQIALKADIECIRRCVRIFGM